MDMSTLKIMSVISVIVTRRSLIEASTTNVNTVVTTEPTTTSKTTTPSPTIFNNDVSLMTGPVPEWFLMVLAVLLSLLLLTAIAGLIWCCCCKSASVYPGGGSVGESGSGCCPTRRRGSTHHYHNDSPSRRGSTHHYHNDGPRLEKVVNHNTATHSITGHKRTIYPVDETDGVYTTNNGLILVSVKPQEVNGYINNGPSPPKRNVHTIKRYDNTTSRSDNGSHDLKKIATGGPKWMPHTHGYRNNNTSTH